MRFSLMNDYMFKKYFSIEENLRAFLKLIDIPIGDEKIIIENNESKDSVSAKGSRFDVRISIGSKVIDLEGQNRLEGDYISHVHREIHYASQIHSGVYKEGESYNNEYQTYVIFIDDFNIPEDNYIVRKRFCSDIINEEYNDIVIIDVSLKKYNKCANIELRELLEVLPTKEIKKFETNIAKEAMKMIEYWNDDEMEIIRAQNALRTKLLENTIRENAQKEGLEQGMAKGIEEERRNIVIALHKNGLSIENISTMANLDLDIVKSIINDN